MGKFAFLEKTFASVGWFIPPYIQMGALDRIANDIQAHGNGFGQDALQRALAHLYDAQGLAGMVLDRYAQAPIIRDYKITIAESVEAHFFGLHHIAVGGLIPVIEGAGRELAAQRGMEKGGVKEVFLFLAASCKQESLERNIGNSDEVAALMDSFSGFTSGFLYSKSEHYPLHDKTNRHGITHGAYKDVDYGKPINFYKTIAAVDVLTFVSSFRANLSWFAPGVTQRSFRLASYYRTLRGVRNAMEIGGYSAWNLFNP